jgi:hypothetical protein
VGGDRRGCPAACCLAMQVVLDCGGGRSVILLSKPGFAPRPTSYIQLLHLLCIAQMHAPSEL